MLKAVAIVLFIFSSALCSANTNLPEDQPEPYHHEKQDQKSEHGSEEPDPYRLTNDFKDHHQYVPTWNPHRIPNIPRPSKYINVIGYPNPIFVPYPVLIHADYLYPYSGVDDYDDAMSRGNSRRPSMPLRNSPIYYVRVPPTPYMFVPGLGYTSQPPTFAPNFSPMLHYNPISALPVQHAINPIINLPVNFLANGKPTNMFQLNPQDIQSPYQPFAPPKPYRPPYIAPPQYTPDSKITHLKRPFVFNGKPEEIFFLSNNFNSMQQMYQPSLQSYY